LKFPSSEKQKTDTLLKENALLQEICDRHLGKQFNSEPIITLTQKRKIVISASDDVIRVIVDRFKSWDKPDVEKHNRLKRKGSQFSETIKKELIDEYSPLSMGIDSSSHAFKPTKQQIIDVLDFVDEVLSSDTDHLGQLQHVPQRQGMNVVKRNKVALELAEMVKSRLDRRDMAFFLADLFHVYNKNITEGSLYRLLKKEGY
jgi:hypothetical protein